MADETMSLEQVRDWHLQECEIWQEAQEDDNAEHNLACARAIEVAIAERKVAEAYRARVEGVAASIKVYTVPPVGSPPNRVLRRWFAQLMEKPI